MFSTFCNYVKVLIGLIFVRGGATPQQARYGCVDPGIRYFRGQFLPGH